MSEPTFEERIPEIRLALHKRRHRWTLAAVEWKDIESVIFNHIYRKYHTFDPARGEFSHWLSGLISNQISNELRNRWRKYQRPCVRDNCPYNTGNSTCSKTPSGLQCVECPAFRKWQEKKELEHNIAQTLTIENHTQEVFSRPDDSINLEAGKARLDVHLKKRLTRHDYRIYKMLYVQHLEEAEVGKKMGYKTKKGTMYAGYLAILDAKKRIVATSKVILAEEDVL